MRSPSFHALASSARRRITRLLIGSEMGRHAFYKLSAGSIGAQELRALLDRGLSPNWISPGGDSLLSACYRQDLAWAARMLIDWGASVSRLDAMGFDEMTLAAGRGATSCMELLAERGLDLISARPRPGFEGSWSPMAQAAFHGQTAALSLMIERGANPSISDSDGTTPLMMAARAGRKEAVALLLALGADASARDRHGRSALELALLCGYIEPARLLLSALGDRASEPSDLIDRIRASAAQLHFPAASDDRVDWRSCEGLALSLEERRALSLLSTSSEPAESSRRSAPPRL